MPGFIGIHLGAGQHSETLWPDYKKLCHRACKKGYSLLASGATALETVTDVTALLENSPLTNAGYGSNLTWDGHVECDASVMDGSTLHFGAVGAVPGVKNPVKLAQHICKKQRCNALALGRIPPCLLVGNGAHQWAEQAQLATVHSKSLISDKALKLYRHYKKKVERYELRIDKILTPLDTIGAVCVDACGNLAAACSSGGVALKHPGRVGQAATYGCGCWAANATFHVPAAIATCTSGCGEHLVRTMLAREAALEVQRSSCTVTGLHHAMKTKFLESPFLSGVEERLGGLILLKCIPSDGTGEFLWTHSSKTMCISYMSDAERRPRTRLSELPNGAVPGSTLVVEGATFKLNPLVERAEIGIYS
ncbi:Threonine aspartase 1 [Cryptotermes secundus]|uniref:Threonine aspartase 1 n=1 Tax=Cryptotermes secundus TaxID=105785 RepID=A0A2J7PNP8_9NEOP|nr:threonine aspartase 1 isoform X3 [Cryptotermes secundus]PNF17965.1 Threonine aspartase 1 [Cryptotermes secundus]